MQNKARELAGSLGCESMPGAVVFMRGITGKRPNTNVTEIIKEMAAKHLLYEGLSYRQNLSLRDPVAFDLTECQIYIVQLLAEFDASELQLAIVEFERLLEGCSFEREAEMAWRKAGKDGSVFAEGIAA
jgi:hypothetical protein